MSLARKMKRRETVPNLKEQKKQAELNAKAEALTAELNRKIDKDRYAAEVQAFYKLSILTNWILHDKWGFGEGRLQKFQDEMARLCACVQDPACDISVDDIDKQLKADTGYDTIWHLNNRRYTENAEVAS